ncbi:DNA polymerase delta small subunit-like [Brassica rapa]|uniref:DNA polymerase delta small subunit-like n=1 Tax=Brassica campestris TaxID=3711 RepID=UPI00142DC479|nr:DNA polymerase delta small subunit-like [Brassica rapa]
MAALVRRRAQRKERKLMTVRWIVSVGGEKEAKKEAFKKYLEFSGVIDSLTKDLGLAAQIVHVVIAATLLNSPDMSYKDQSILYEPIKELDIMLNQTVLVDAGVSVDIISGVNDPPPISCLFPRSAPYNTFRSCRNLHSFDVDNIRFLGTYGKKINDLHKYSEAKSKLDFVERALRWRHLASTAPNTLRSEGQLVRLICIPKFCEIGIAVAKN